MRRRIFIAVNLPEDIKKSLWNYRLKWPELPSAWTKRENLHITLVFAGYVLDQDLIDIFRIANDVASQRQPCLINLKKICYGPPKKIPPRMVWAVGEKNEELGKMQNALENSLVGANASLEEKNRPYAPHITLGRIKTWEWRRIEPEERPEIEEEINLSFEANSIEVMESRLKRGGPEYTVLESYGLGSVAQ